MSIHRLFPTYVYTAALQRKRRGGLGNRQLLERMPPVAPR